MTNEMKKNFISTYDETWGIMSTELPFTKEQLAAWDKEIRILLKNIQ
jgi:hypothetical protein